MLCPESGSVIASGGVTTSAAAEEVVLVRIRGLSLEALQGWP